MEFEGIATKEKVLAAYAEHSASKAASSNNAEVVSQWEERISQLAELGEKLGVTELEFTRALFEGRSTEERQSLVAVYLDGLGNQESWEELQEEVTNLVTVANEFGLKIK